jgi:acyl carrier protein
VVAASPFYWDRFLRRFDGAVPPLLRGIAAQQQLQQPAPPSASKAGGGRLSREGVRAAVRQTVLGVLGGAVSEDEPLMAAGLDSLGAVELRNSLEASLGLQLPGTLMFDYPSISAISDFICGQVEEQADDVAEDQAVAQPGGQQLVARPSLGSAARGGVLAVVGSASRSPGGAISLLQARDGISKVRRSPFHLECLNATVRRRRLWTGTSRWAHIAADCSPPRPSPPRANTPHPPLPPSSAPPGAARALGPGSAQRCLPGGALRRLADEHRGL